VTSQNTWDNTFTVPNIGSHVKLLWLFLCANLLLVPMKLLLFVKRLLLRVVLCLTSALFELILSISFLSTVPSIFITDIWYPFHSRYCSPFFLLHVHNFTSWTQVSLWCVLCRWSRNRRVWSCCQTLWGSRTISLHTLWSLKWLGSWSTRTGRQVSNLLWICGCIFEWCLSHNGIE